MSDAAAEKELTDEELAEQWAAEAEGDDEDNGQPERVLSQDEIDNLLGGAGGDDKETGGINFLINNSKLSHERLPMLEVVFDRLVKNLTTTLRNFTASTVDLSVDEMTSVRFGDYLDTVSLPALLTVFKAEEWESLSLMYVETGLVYALVDTLLGGQNNGELKIEGRPFTSIERGLVKEFSEIILADFTQAFSSISPVTFSYDRMETTPRFAAIVRPVDAAILVNMRIVMDGKGGNVQFCIPYASIEPVRDQIVQMFMGEKSGGDNIWSGHLRHEVWDAEVSVDTILGEAELPLQEILSWKVGSQLMLRTKPQSIVKACVGGFRILEGKVGRRDGRVSLRVEQNLVREKLKQIYASQQEDKK